MHWIFFVCCGFGCLPCFLWGSIWPWSYFQYFVLLVTRWPDSRGTNFPPVETFSDGRCNPHMFNNSFWKTPSTKINGHIFFAIWKFCSYSLAHGQWLCVLLLGRVCVICVGGRVCLKTFVCKYGLYVWCRLTGLYGKSVCV